MNWYKKCQKTAGSENKFKGGVEGLLKNLCKFLGGHPERIERELGILGFKVDKATGQDGNMALRISVKDKLYLIENLNNPTVKLEFYEVKVNKTASLRGEWWIVDGNSLFADGDTGDMGHEGYVIQEIQSKYAYDEFNHGEYVDWDGFKKELAMEEYEEQFGQRPTEQYYQKYKKTMEDLYLKKLKEMGITNEEYLIAEGMGNPRQYGMENLGWKRVAGNNIQTQTLTPEDLKSIANGLYDAYQEEIEDNTLFNIEVNGNNRFYQDVPYYLISDGAPSQLEQYNTNAAYAKNNNQHKIANKYTDQLKEEMKKYKNPKDFAKDYEVLYHGGSENIIGDKLSNGGRVVGPVTQENLGKGSDYGGIFFTPEKQLAETFKGHAPGGKGKVHTFLVRKNNIFDENNPQHARMLKNFIGKNYINEDGEPTKFEYNMYDFIFPMLEDGRRHMDWATFDPNILAAMGFEGAKVIEHYGAYGAYGEGKHLYSTVLFTGGEKSPHWKVEEGQTPEDIYNRNASDISWYKTAKKWHKVDSTAIDSISYDNGTLEVRFAKDKSTFKYYRYERENQRALAVG